MNYKQNTILLNSFIEESKNSDIRFRRVNSGFVSNYGTRPHYSLYRIRLFTKRLAFSFEQLSKSFNSLQKA